MKVGKEVTCTKSITDTGFYFGQVDSNIKNILGISMGTDSVQTRQILTNKNATIYPFHADPYSGKVMTEPAKANWARTPSIDWTTTDRANYIKKYSELYPNNNWNWSGSVTNIHHIRPRNLGGTNAFDNLIPISTVLHQSVVTPWFAAY
ncbi:HNH endonuclease signature motif containing protein [Paenibacillus bouchesdurhonensis]|uniref:HNH endonuclease signature motif containing protein n=1 Tax=Paenibacillus bouchesdurhonensis TaxID=1870990 RepID=UPI0018FF1D91|nr:HNH endonuclease signature motif containing protein [Paenibacillus bouchesdurhonensis]